MWKKQKDWLLINNKIKKWIKENKVVDVVIFGSFVRGKSKPNDLDLCIINREEKDSLDLVDSLSKVFDSKFKVQINILLEKEFLKGKNSLVKTLLLEGFSIKENKELAGIYGFKSKVLFFYSLKEFKPSERVRFHYLLRGRYGQEGLLSKYNSSLLNNGLIEAPIYYEDLLKEVFDQWKIKFNVKRILES